MNSSKGSAHRPQREETDGSRDIFARATKKTNESKAKTVRERNALAGWKVGFSEERLEELVDRA